MISDTNVYLSQIYESVIENVVLPRIGLEFFTVELINVIEFEGYPSYF